VCEWELDRGISERDAVPAADLVDAVHTL